MDMVATARRSVVLAAFHSFFCTHAACARVQGCVLWGMHVDGGGEGGCLKRRRNAGGPFGSREATDCARR